MDTTFTQLLNNFESDPSEANKVLLSKHVQKVQEQLYSWSNKLYNYDNACIDRSSCTDREYYVEKYAQADAEDAERLKLIDSLA